MSKRAFAKCPKQRRPPVRPILEHALGSPGKRMRPAIAIAASQVFPGPIEAPVLVATGVELLHIATLVHDDTVDDTPLRRGRSTVASTWGAPMAVLAGDYIFAAAASYVCKTGNLRWSNASRRRSWNFRAAS